MDNACDEYKEMMGVETSMSSFKELLRRAAEAKRKKDMGEHLEETPEEEQSKIWQGHFSCAPTLSAVITFEFPHNTAIQPTAKGRGRKGQEKAIAKGGHSK